MRSAPAQPKFTAFRREFLPKDPQWLNLLSRVESNDVSAPQTQCVRRPAGDAAVYSDSPRPKSRRRPRPDSRPCPHRGWQRFGRGRPFTATTRVQIETKNGFDFPDEQARAKAASAGHTASWETGSKHVRRCQRNRHDLFSSPMIFVNSKRRKWPCVQKGQREGNYDSDRFRSRTLRYSLRRVSPSDSVNCGTHNLMLPRIPWTLLGILNVVGAFANWASGAAMHRKITRQSRWNLRRVSDKAIPNQAPETGGRRRDWMASIPRG